MCPECGCRNIYCQPDPVEIIDRTGERTNARIYDCANCGNFFAQPREQNEKLS